MIKEKIIIDDLTNESVSVKRLKIYEENGEEYTVGYPSRCAYMNTINGRKALENEVPEIYVKAILSVWGDTVIIEENYKQEITKL